MSGDVFNQEIEIGQKDIESQGFEAALDLDYTIIVIDLDIDILAVKQLLTIVLQVLLSQVKGIEQKHLYLIIQFHLMILIVF